MTHQPSFSRAEFAIKKKTTRREKFLMRMEALIPWTKLLTVIEPFYPKGERGRPPIGLERMLRIYFLQQWYGQEPRPMRRESFDRVRLAVRAGIATRARACLIVVGDRQMAKNSNVPYLRSFEAHVTRREEQARRLTSQREKPKDGRYPETDGWAVVSDWERTLFYALWKAGLETIPQYPVEKYQLDIAHLAGEQKLDIEVDGEHYHKKWNGEIRQRDHLRNKRPKELGWDVQRFWVYELRDNLEGCVAWVRTRTQKHERETG